MLQEAHVGIGLFGKEGNQAARSSDYALYSFSHLSRLLFIHGRYCKLRTSLLLQYHLYKNFAVFLVNFWFSFFNGYSALPMYGDWMLSAFNAIMVSVPPVWLGIFEKDLPETICENNPKAYIEVQQGIYLSIKSFIRWGIFGIYHSLVLFFIPFLAFLTNQGLVAGDIVVPADLYFFSSLLAGTGVVLVVLIYMLCSKNWTAFFAFAVLFSLGVSTLILTLQSTTYEYYYDYMNTYSVPETYFVVVITLAIAFLPNICYEYIIQQYFPTNAQILLEVHKLGNNPKKRNQIIHVMCLKIFI